MSLNVNQTNQFENKTNRIGLKFVILPINNRLFTDSRICLYLRVLRTLIALRYNAACHSQREKR